MLIVISGVPGTGKSDVSKELSKLIDAKVIDLKAVAVKRELVEGLDEKRSTIVLNEKRITGAIKKEMKEKGKYVLDSHLGHFVDKKLVKLLIILRCDPKVLEKRLKKRGYHINKVSENVMAEYLDTVLIESLKNGFKNKIHEIDTSKRKAKNIALEIKRILDKKKEKSYGKTSWF